MRGERGGGGEERWVCVCVAWGLAGCVVQLVLVAIRLWLRCVRFVLFFFFSFFFSMDCFSRVARSRGVARFSPQWTVTFYRGCATWGPSVSEAEEMGPLAVNGLTCVFASVRGLTC